MRRQYSKYMHCGVFPWWRASLILIEVMDGHNAVWQSFGNKSATNEVLLLAGELITSYQSHFMDTYDDILATQEGASHGESPFYFSALHNVRKQQILWGLNPGISRTSAKQWIYDYSVFQAKQSYWLSKQQFPPGPLDGEVTDTYDKILASQMLQSGHS